MNRLPISVSVHTVTSAIAPAIAHSNRSAASDRRRSFQAERTMMPITAAPTP